VAARNRIETRIAGPAATYKTAMLVLVANAEVERGAKVVFSTSDMSESALRKRGLRREVEVRVTKGFGEEVTSSRGGVTYVWSAITTRPNIRTEGQDDG